MTKIDELDHIQTTLTAFYLCHKGLLPSHLPCNIVLSQLSLNPRLAKGTYEPPIPIIIDAFRQMRIPLDPVRATANPETKLSQIRMKLVI